ncbi:MAG: hypothetical protein OXJ53_01320 [Gammaproteobacteria bacterium]|nr:hypothetical protein [Gammaproteobacteria bacterium]MDE0271173.1 hypothetical protein [Gammaproteobacteria bacterium]
MAVDNGRNRTLAEADFQAIRQIVRTEVREEVHEQLFGLEFTEHVGNIVLGALEVKLQEGMAPIRQGLRQAGEGLMAAGTEPAKEKSHEATG